MKAVASDATAVMIFTSAESQNIGVQSVHTSIKCVAPHATMKEPNATNIQL
jgi:hypothetical protein